MVKSTEWVKMLCTLAGMMSNTQNSKLFTSELREK